MSARHFVFLACLTTVAPLAACGDDDGADGTSSGGGKVDTGLPPTDKLSSLDDKDAQQACKSTAKALNNVLPQSSLEKIGCALAAITVIMAEKEGEDLSSADVAECKQIVQDCLDGTLVDEEGNTFEVDTQVADDSKCDQVNAADTFQGCQATVAEYESCASKVTSEVKARFNSVNCDALKDYAKFDMDAQTIDVSKAPECKAVADKCPNLDLVSTAESSGEN
jgi:hypothetical protein